MSRVRSRRWTVEVSVEGERREIGKDPVEAVWIHYWQRAGSEAIEVERVEMWAEPWGDPVAALLGMDIRDNAPEWLKNLVAEYMPVWGEV